MTSKIAPYDTFRSWHVWAELQNDVPDCNGMIGARVVAYDVAEVTWNRRLALEAGGHRYLLTPHNPVLQVFLGQPQAPVWFSSLEEIEIMLERFGEFIAELKLFLSLAEST